MIPKFSDVKEISDKEFKKKIDEETKTRDIEIYGRDGSFDVWRKTYKYRNIKYDIALLRYYQIGVTLSEIKGMNKHGKWFVLEHPKETEEIVETVKKIFDDSNDFLYADTLHVHNNNQTLEEMFYEMVHRAKTDIDMLLDEGGVEVDKKISLFQSFKETVGKFKEMGG